MNWDWFMLGIHVATLILWIVLFKREKEQKDFWHKAWKQQSQYVLELQTYIIRSSSNEPD